MEDLDAAHLSLRDVSHGYGHRLLLDHINLAIAPGEHVVIVGENGAGKSTLLRLLAGQEKPDDGQVTTAEPAGFLGQVVSAEPGDTVQSMIDGSLGSIRELEHRILNIADQLAALPGSGHNAVLDGKATGEGSAGDREAGVNGELDAAGELADLYGHLQTEFELRDGYRVDARVDAALERLGLGGLDRGRTVESLSGGERERVALACLFADPPPVLLMDEPTNHLDAAAVEWLEAALKAFAGTSVVVTHDRAFLKNIARTIVEVDADSCAVARYGDGYAGYVRAKAAARARWEQDYQQWLDDMDAQRLQADTIADKQGYGRRRDGDKMAYGFKASTWQKAASSRIRNAQERLRRLQENPVPKPPEPLHLATPAAPAASKILTDADADAAAGSPDAATAPPAVAIRATGLLVPGRLDVASFELGMTEKVLVTGPNGAGKTTFLDVCAGLREPGAGSVERFGSVGYLPQELHTPAAPQQRLLPAFASGLQGDIDELAEKLLRFGLFRTGDFHLPVGGLSAGQRRRLSLARLLAGEHNVILLDEPTNHLAPLLVDELEAALAEFPGAVVIVSHDRAMQNWFDKLRRNGGVGGGNRGGRHVKMRAGTIVSDRRTAG